MGDSHMLVEVSVEKQEDAADHSGFQPANVRSTGSGALD
jgi:hypothetical protein